MKNTKLWFITGIIILIVAVLWYFDELMMTLLFAAVLAFLLNPIVNWFQKIMRVKKRFFPTLFTFILSLGAISGLLAIFLPPLYRQIETVVVSIDDYLAMLADILDNLGTTLGSLGLPDKIIELADNALSSLGDTIVSLVTTAGSYLLQKTLKVFDLIVFLVITFHFMLDGKNIINGLINLFGNCVQIRLRRMGRELKDLIWGYMRVKLLTSAIVFLVTLAVYSGFGIPNALLLAFIAFCLEFIPFFGPIISGIVATVAALIGDGWQTAIWILIIDILIQQIEGNIIEPIVQGRHSDVPPVSIIISLLVCEKLWGVVGMFLAIPMAGFAKVIVLEIRDLYRSIDSPNGFGYATPEPLVTSVERKDSRALKALRALKQKICSRKKKGVKK